MFAVEKCWRENYAYLIFAPLGGAASLNLLLLRCRCFIAKNEVIKLYEMSCATRDNFLLCSKINQKLAIPQAITELFDYFIC